MAAASVAEAVRQRVLVAQQALNETNKTIQSLEQSLTAARARRVEVEVTLRTLLDVLRSSPATPAPPQT